MLLAAGPGPEPVVFIPGFGGTGPTSESAGTEWLTTRGIAPDRLALEPLTHSYDDIVATLKEVGYVEGETLFIANWDWRVPVGPRDGMVNGTVEGVAAQLADNGTATTFESGVDYFGWTLAQAQSAYAASNSGATLEYVDVITHSTGGLVARTYMQSDAYGLDLPEIDDLILAGVPSEGVSQTWGTLQDEWNIKPANRAAARAVDKAWDLLQDGTVAAISGPGGDITVSNLAADDLGTPADESKQDFVRRYIGAANDLIGTYELVDVGADGTFAKLVDIPELSGFANTLVDDINFGDSPKNMVERLGTGVTVIVYSDDVATAGQVIQRQRPDAVGQAAE